MSRMKDGIAVCTAYAGEEAFSAYFNTLAANRHLAKHLIESSYGDLMADPVISLAQKAVINTVVVTMLDDTSPALALHKAAMSKQGIKKPDQATCLGYMLRNSPDDLDEKNAGWTLGHQTFLMAKIAGLSVLGPNHPVEFKATIRQALEEIGAEKTAYAINLASISAGPTAAVAASAVFGEALAEYRKALTEGPSPFFAGSRSNG